MADSIDWPIKTREINDAYFESARWNGFGFRDGDVVIAAYPKVGTNWTQQIAWQLAHGGPPGVDGLLNVAWLDLRIAPFKAIMDAYEAQTDRRIIKTHLPLEALVFSPKAKYLVLGRDARDMVWSAYNHQQLNSDEVLALFNGPPGRPGAAVARPDRDIRDYYLHFLEHDDLPGFAFEPFWPHVRGWWTARGLPNVLLVHYANLKADLPREIRRIARFLTIEIDEAALPAMVEHCRFDYMRAGANNHPNFNKGFNGRWKDVLSPAEMARCDEVALQNLTPDCAHWLASGELPE
ncbi:MAG TPA: sulfotransferase domain-containing protein [Caulobacteraceae bacterium]